MGNSLSKSGMKVMSGMALVTEREMRAGTRLWTRARGKSYRLLASTRALSDWSLTFPPFSSTRSDSPSGPTVKLL